MSRDNSIMIMLSLKIEPKENLKINILSFEKMKVEKNHIGR